MKTRLVKDKLKRILLVLDENKVPEFLIDSVIGLSKLLELKVELVSIIEMPENWLVLNRNAKEKHPESKIKMRELRETLDANLKILRLNEVNCSKRILCCSPTTPVSLNTDKQSLLLTESENFFHAVKDDFKPIHHTIANSNCPILAINRKFNPNSLIEIILVSNYKSVHPAVVQLLDKLMIEMRTYLDLIFINTPDDFENSDESIARIKNFISSNCLSNTRISIFNDNNLIKGIGNLVKLKSADLLCVDNFKHAQIKQIKKMDVPLLFLPKV